MEFVAVAPLGGNLSRFLPLVFLFSWVGQLSLLGRVPALHCCLCCLAVGFVSSSLWLGGSRGPAVTPFV